MGDRYGQIEGLKYRDRHDITGPRHTLRVGRFGIGLDTCWPQFACLKERLEGCLARVAQKLVLLGVEVVNRGLSVEMSVKHGPMTLISVVQTEDGWFKLPVAEGDRVLGHILEIGNIKSRYRFPNGARQFVESWKMHGPACHHWVGVGHIAGKLEELDRLLQAEVVRI